MKKQLLEELDLEYDIAPFNLRKQFFKTNRITKSKKRKALKIKENEFKKSA